MTRFLASVRNVDEALLALDAGVDIIDLKDPDKGALGALPSEVIAEIVERIASSKPISATIGDLNMEAQSIVCGVEHTVALGVDIVKVGFFGAAKHRECAKALQALTADGNKVVAVLFADQSPDFTLLPVLMEAGFYGVMLDTSIKNGVSLTEYMTRHELEDFVRLAKQYRLESGLAGSLQLSEISALSELGPGYLGFRGALCTKSQRTEKLEQKKMEQAGKLLRENNIMHECAGWV